LVVSQKAANQLLVFDVDDGVARLASVNPSAGAVPFGFDIDQRDQVIVSEAFAGDVSSYELRERTDNLALVTASAHTYQGAPCWLILTPNGRYAYTGNAATGTITGFSVNHKGLLNILVPSGLSASTGAGSHTTDLATSDEGEFLYALANVGQTVNAFHIAHDGSLTPAGVFTGVPTSAVGLVVK
jgi:6-phosphogluconolactonase